MSTTSLPVRLRQARGAMSLAEASERSGVPEERIRMYEEGERQPYAKTLRRLAQTYGASARELSGGTVADRGTAPRVHADASRLRRRRRRVRSDDGADAHASVEVPIEVEEDQTIRVVIELIIRPKAPIHSTGAPPREGGRGPTQGGRGPGDPGQGPGQRSSGEPNRGTDVAPHAGPRAERISSGPNGPDPGEPRDPMDEFKRAYSQFRRTKR